MQDEKRQIQLILKGDRQALKDFIEQHQRLVFSLVGRYVHNNEDQREISQEVFIAAYEKLPMFRFECKLSTWMAKIAINRAINYCRKMKLPVMSDVVQESDETDFQSFENNDFSNEGPQQEKMIANERENALNLAIQQLPQVYRTILTLYHWQQFSYAEISEALSMPEGTIKNYLFRARKLLKERLIREKFIEEYLT